MSDGDDPEYGLGLGGFRLLLVLPGDSDSNCSIGFALTPKSIS